MISVGRQQNRAGGFDTPFAPGAPYFVVAPAQAFVRRESLPPIIRKRIGFNQIKVVPIRWPTVGGPGGVSLYGSGGGGINWVNCLVIVLALYGGWVIFERQIKHRRR